MAKLGVLASIVLWMASFAPAQTFKVIFTFNGGASGAFPEGTLLRDGHGDLYGVTLNGGIGNGIVFKVDSSGAETVLHNFAGSPDGQYPSSGLVHDNAGHLYGITENGGADDAGAAYELNLQGKERVLHSFGSTSNDGVFPFAPMVRDSAGNLYGTAQTGNGNSQSGMVFKINSAGVETIVHSFSQSTTDGNDPVGGVILDSAGNLYGTTFGGGAHSKGTVYKIDTSGKETLLYSFGQNSTDGVGPEDAPTRDASGNLYGTTNTGGRASLGTVFKVDSSGKETVLHSFTGGSDGANPSGGLVLGPAGNLYGATTFGGTANFGVLYEIDSMGKETILHTFSGLSDGGNPQATLTRDAAGNLYGTAGGGTGNGAFYGTLFEFTP